MTYVTQYTKSKSKGFEISCVILRDNENKTDELRLGIDVSTESSLVTLCFKCKDVDKMLLIIDANRPRLKKMLRMSKDNIKSEFLKWIKTEGLKP